jgi:hypothetical protein
MFSIMYVPGASMPEFFQLRLGFVTSTSCGRAEAANSLHCAAGYNWVVMLGGALQRNAKNEARLSNISEYGLAVAKQRI